MSLHNIIIDTVPFQVVELSILIPQSNGSEVKKKKKKKKKRMAHGITVLCYDE